MTIRKWNFKFASLTFLLLSLPVLADPIVKPYQGIRSSGMGGVKLLTGLYDENFFGNPARTIANDHFKITVFDLMVEANSNVSSTVKAGTQSGDVLSSLGGTAGNNNHFRVQTAFPAVYLPVGDGRNAYAFGLLSSIQGDINLHRDFQASFPLILDAGPAFSFARKFLPDGGLVVGTTAHVAYRAALPQSVSLIDFIHGNNLPSLSQGADGAMLDFDLGSTYLLPLEPLGFKLNTGVTISNLLGGNYSNLGVHFNANGNFPPPQPRTYGGGISATKDLGPFKNFVVALEVQDVGNNPDGSLFRTIHIGSEARYGILLPRVGLNQGYLAAGLGIDLRHFTLDLATYGEELSLDSGIAEDRRYALQIALAI